MTKAELLKALQPFHDDDVVICIDEGGAWDNIISIGKTGSCIEVLFGGGSPFESENPKTAAPIVYELENLNSDESIDGEIEELKIAARALANSADMYLCGELHRMDLEDAIAKVEKLTAIHI